jgi:hypothetical protein
VARAAGSASRAAAGTTAVIETASSATSMTMADRKRPPVSVRRPGTMADTSTARFVKLVEKLERPSS